MTGAAIFAYLVLPVLVGAIGVSAVYLHGRADDASRRAEAEAKRLEG